MDGWNLEDPGLAEPGGVGIPLLLPVLWVEFVGCARGGEWGERREARADDVDDARLEWMSALYFCVYGGRVSVGVGNLCQIVN